MSTVISATFSYGGISDFPGSAYGEDAQFFSQSQNSGEAIEEFVSWVIGVGAGAVAALTLNEITDEIDPDRDLDFLLDQFLSLEVKIKIELMADLKLALRRSPSYALVESVLDGSSGKKIRDEFFVLALSCIDTENPGPLLSEDLESFFF